MTTLFLTQIIYFWENSMFNREIIKKDLIIKFNDIINFYNSKEQIEEENDINTFIDVRLQLVDNTYYIHVGDSQYDTDYRGGWGYESINILQQYTEYELELVADKIIEDVFWDLKHQ